MSTQLSFRLNTGALMPGIGLGTWQSTNSEGEDAVMTAIQAGYRHLDTAWRYGNGKAIGKGIKASGIPRSSMFLTDKIWGTYHKRAQEALDESLAALDVEFLDLWLMHWPISFNHAGNDRGVPKLRDGTRDLEPDWDYLKTWQAMESIYANNPDKVKAIGVSNCSTHHLRAIMAIARVVPAVNQVELHPSLPQVELVSYCKENCIQLVAHSPLGSPESKLMTEPTILEIARNHGGTAAQCLISWGLQKGWAVLPKSSSRPRIVSNLNTFELSQSDMEAIDELGSLCPRRYVTPAWAHDIWLDDTAGLAFGQ